MEEGNEVITDDGKLAETFNEYFVNIVLSLGITSFYGNNDYANNDNIGNTITKFEGHLSKVAIKYQLKTYSKTSLSRMLVQTKPLRFLRK